MVTRTTPRQFFVGGPRGFQRREGPASRLFSPVGGLTLEEQLLTPRKFIRFGGGRPGRSREQIQQLQAEAKRRADLGVAKSLLAKAQSKLLTPKEKATLERITAPIVIPTREQTFLRARASLTRAEQSRLSKQMELEARRTQVLSDQEKLDIRERALQGEGRVLQRLADKGLLRSPQVIKFNKKIADLSKDQSTLTSKAGTTQKQIAQFKGPEETRVITDRSVVFKDRPGFAPGLPTTAIEAIPEAEILKAIKLEQIKESPLLRALGVTRRVPKRVVKAEEFQIQPFEIPLISEESARRVREATIAGMQFGAATIGAQPSVFGARAGGVVAANLAILEEVARGAADLPLFAFETVTGKPIRIPIKERPPEIKALQQRIELFRGRKPTFAPSFEQVIKATAGIPFIGPVLGATEAVTPSGRVIITRPALRDLGVSLALLVGPEAIGAIPKGVRVVGKVTTKARFRLEDILARVPRKKPLTQEEIGKILLEGITKPTEFPLTFKIKEPKVPIVKEPLGPAFPISFKIKEPSFVGLKKITPTKGKPPTLDLAGIIPIKKTKGVPPVLETAGLVFERFRKPKIFREKPLPFFEEVIAKQRVITITKPVKRVKKTKRVTDFEPSTQAFAESTQVFKPQVQRVRARFFEEFEIRPLERFLPKEARVPKVGFLSGVALRLRERPLQVVIPGISTVQIQRVQDVQKQRESSLQALRNRFAELTSLGSAESLKEIQSLRQRQAQRLRELQRTVTRTVPRITPRITRPPRVTRPRVPPRRPPLILLPLPQVDEPQFRRPEDDPQRGFNVFLRRKGRLVRQNKVPLTRPSAFGLGFLLADESVARSGVVREAKKSGKSVPALNRATSIAFKFRKPRGKTKLARDSFVERSRFAIDSVGELEGITARGRAKAERNRSIRRVLKIPALKRKKSSRRRK